MLSINDTPEVRSVFDSFDLQEVQLNYRISGAVTAARELIISGPTATRGDDHEPAPRQARR